MPEVVASHFAAEGVADGFMPRGQYVAIMLAVVLLVPLLHLERPPLVGATALLFLALSSAWSSCCAGSCVPPDPPWIRAQQYLRRTRPRSSAICRLCQR